jgi:hypothetical protein
MDETPKAGSVAPLSPANVKERNDKRLELITKLAAVDAEFRKRLLKNPKEILDEIGVIYPRELDVMAVELPEKTLPLIIPPFVGQR